MAAEALNFFCFRFGPRLISSAAPSKAPLCTLLSFTSTMSKQSSAVKRFYELHPNLKCACQVHPDHGMSCMRFSPGVGMLPALSHAWSLLHKSYAQRRHSGCLQVTGARSPETEEWTDYASLSQQNKHLKTFVPTVTSECCCGLCVCVCMTCTLLFAQAGQARPVPTRR